MNDSTNLTTSIIQTINSIFETLFSSVDTTVYNILDDLVFIDTSILNDSIFKKTFGINSYRDIIKSSKLDFSAEKNSYELVVAFLRL